MSRRFSLFILLAVLVVFVGARGQQPAPAEDWQTFTEELDARVPTWMWRYGVPGAAVGLVRGGEVAWVKGYGWANKAGRVPVTPETAFCVASISKPVTAWGVMRLVEEGQIDLDAPVDGYLTRWHLPLSPFDASGVTTRRLLSHMAGVNVEGYAGYDIGQPLPTLEGSLAGSARSNTAVHLVQEPGKSFLYSTGGYTILQLLVEERTGQLFAGYMEQEVLQPLGMTHSSFVRTPAVAATLATGYDGLGQALPEVAWVEQAGGGFYTTVGDLALLAAAAMPGPGGEPAGRGVLAPETLEQMFAPAPGAQSVYGLYGLGYAAEVLPNGVRVISHGGNITGWNAYLAFLPQQGDGLVILTNGDGGFYFRDEILAAWGRWAAGGLPSDARIFLRLQQIVRIVAVVLGLGLLLYAGRVIRQLWTEKRRFTAKLRGRRLVRLPFVLLGLAAWWVTWYSGVIGQVVFGLPHYLLFTFFPPDFWWLSGVVTVGGVFLAGITFAPRGEVGGLRSEV